MAQQIFSVLNKTTGKKDLVKAETKGQVTRFLASQFVVEKPSQLDVATIMASGGQLLDATVVAAEEPAEKPAEADAPAQTGGCTDCEAGCTDCKDADTQA